MRKSVSLLVGAILAAAVPAAAAEKLAPEAQLARAVEGRVAGAPVHCISLRPTQSSEVITNSAIIYQSGSTLYVNRPRSGAQSLDDQDILLTRTFSSQLCSGDVVEVIDGSSGMMRGLVFLGEFVPYKRAR
ncbi:MAG TPA: hypothetical protein VF582_01830 [Allosphingosinicella sp.]|jgi:hypothetical protein